MPTQLKAQSPGFSTPLNVIGGIIAVSLVASAFIVWLVYFHTPLDSAGRQLAFLPGLNAVLNTLSAIALVIGYRYIRQRRLVEHRSAMFAAFFFSSLFLAAYLTNFALHGESKFPGHGIARTFYLYVLLLPHILGATIALPMILVTFFLSLSGRFPLHRMVARYTFPLWLYVSVSGVIVYAMLAAYS